MAGWWQREVEAADDGRAWVELGGPGRSIRLMMINLLLITFITSRRSRLEDQIEKIVLA